MKRVLLILLLLTGNVYAGTNVYPDPKILEGIKYVVFEANGGSYTCQEGMLKWDSDEKTFDICTNKPDVTITLGKEQHIDATNKTGADLTRGTVVYVSGAQGNKPTVVKASAATRAASHTVIGLVSETIANNSTGAINISGIVNGLNTSSFAAGDRLYLSPTAGAMVNSSPATPNHEIQVGWVLTSNAENGKILVSIIPSSSLYEDLHDYDSTGRAEGHIIYYNGTSYDSRSIINGPFVNYQAHKSISSSSAALGPTAPGHTVIGATDCLEFDADAEAAYIMHDIQEEAQESWNGISNMILHVHWIAADAAIANGETVKWNISYEVENTEGGVLGGTTTARTVTYTQSGAGIQYQSHDSDIVILKADANNPLGFAKQVYIKFSRDMTGDTYGGGACVTDWHIEYIANKMMKE